jgi:hypothetical protein
MRLRDAWMESRAAAMAARPAFPRWRPRLREETTERGKRRKKKGDDVVPDRRVLRVSDPRVRLSWRWIGDGLVGRSWAERRWWAGWLAVAH